MQIYLKIRKSIEAHGPSLDPWFKQNSRQNYDINKVTRDFSSDFIVDGIKELSGLGEIAVLSLLLHSFVIIFFLEKNILA